MKNKIHSIQLQNPIYNGYQLKTFFHFKIPHFTVKLFTLLLSAY